MATSTTPLTCRRCSRDNYYLNPGSVSIPKENTPRSYMMLEEGVFTWKDLDGAAYHTLRL